MVRAVCSNRTESLLLARESAGTESQTRAEDSNANVFVCAINMNGVYSSTKYAVPLHFPKLHLARKSIC
jgi:hypothetical protein